MSDPVLQRNPRILVIDDNRAIHSAYRKILCSTRPEQGGLEKLEATLFDLPVVHPSGLCFEIESAYQGEEGLALVQEALEKGRRYAMAFVDVRMPPGCDGIETAARIWGMDPEVEIVICTAYSDYSWEEMTLKLGRSDRLVVLRKPFEAVEVLQLASCLTEKWRLHQEAKLTLNHLESLVRERTLVLDATNKRLEGEIAERKKSEAERERIIKSLEEALAKVNTLSGLIPICAGCKRIRDDKGYWSQVKTYVSKHSDAKFSHGLCPECAHKCYPDVARLPQIA